MKDLLALSSQSVDFGQTQVLIDPAHGAVILGYASHLDGQTWHWLAPSGSGDSAQDRVASFVMVPFCSRICDGRFSYAGFEVVLPANNLPERHPIHGHGFRRAWQVLEQSSHALTLGYTHAGDAWPWSYAVSLNLELEGASLLISAALHNTSAASMPAGLGFHPFFPRKAQTRIFASVTQWLPLDAQLMPLTPQELPKDLTLHDGYVLGEAALDHVFVGWTGSARIQWPAWNAELTLTSSPQPSHLVLWAPKGEDYFCLEPVSNLPDGFNHPELPDSFVDIPPDGIHNMHWRLTPKLTSPCL